MRPAYRFALASALGVAALGAAWVWATSVGERTPPPAPEPTAEAAGAEAPSEPEEPVAPPTREEALERMQREEEETLGAREAARRRQVREQMLDARARHLHE